MGSEYVVIAISFGLATGIIGRGKGSSFWIWFVVGTVIPFFGLAKGFLSGKYRTPSDIEGRPRAAGLKKYFEGDRGIGILAALDAVGARIGATPAQVSIAWIMAQPTVAGPIVSVTSVAQLEEIAKAATLELDPEALDELNRASA